MFIYIFFIGLLLVADPA